MKPYSIACTTCQSRLTVRDEAAIGQILACPKCRSMVLVEPPPPAGSEDSARSTSQPPPRPTVHAAAMATASTGAKANATGLDSAFDDVDDILADEPAGSGASRWAEDDSSSPRPKLPANEPDDSAEQTAAMESSDADLKRQVHAVPASQENAATADQRSSMSVNESSADREANDGEATDGDAADTASNNSESNEPEASRGETADDISSDAASGGDEPETKGSAADEPAMTRPAAADAQPVLPGSDWVSPATRQWQQMILTGGAGLLGVAFAVGIFGYFATRPDTDGPEVAATDPSVITDPPVADDAVDPEAIDPEATDPEAADPEAADPEAADPEAIGRAAITPGTADPADPQLAHTPAPPGDAIPDATPGQADAAAQSPPATAVQPAADPNGNAVAADPPGLKPEQPAEGDEIAPEKLAESFGQFADFIDNPPQEDNAAADDANDIRMDDVRERPEPRDVDVAARMNDTISEIRFDGTPLIDFVRFMSDFSTIPISIDPYSLIQNNLSATSPIRMQSGETSFTTVLTSALQPLGLESSISGDQLLIARRGTSQGIRTWKTSIRDLAADDEASQELADAVRRLVYPKSWKEAGGQGHLRTGGGGWVVENSSEELYHVLAFCERLRVARGLDLQTRLPREQFQLQPRRKLASQALATEITVNYLQPTRLEDVLARLAGHARIHILVDWHAVAADGWTPDAETTLTVENASLTETLTSLLRPMDLDWRVINGKLIQVTTPSELAREWDIEFYPVADILRRGTSGDTIIDHAKQSLGRHLFENGEGGALFFDSAGEHLIAALPQRDHISLQVFLAELNR